MNARDAQQQLLEEYAPAYAGVDPLRIDVPKEDLEVHAAAMAHIVQKETPEQLALLEEDPQDWRRILLAQKGRVEALMITMLAERGSKKQECMRKGFPGKQEWFTWYAQWGEHRAKVMTHLQAVDRGIHLVKQIISVDAEEEVGESGILAGINKRFAALEQRVIDLERRGRPRY